MSASEHQGRHNASEKGQGQKIDPPCTKSLF
jgi:hypothetical protein